MIFEDLDSLDNQKGDIKKLIKIYKTKQGKKSINCLNFIPILLTSFYLIYYKINEIFPNSKILNIKNWGKDLVDSGEKIIGEKEGEIKNKSKIEKKDSSHNVFSEYYVPQIVIINNIIGIDD